MGGIKAPSQSGRKPPGKGPAVDAWHDREFGEYGNGDKGSGMGIKDKRDPASGVNWGGASSASTSGNMPSSASTSGNMLGNTSRPDRDTAIKDSGFDEITGDTRKQYGANVAYDRDMFGQVDYAGTKNKYQGSTTEGYEVSRSRGGTQRGTQQSQIGANHAAIDAAKEADTGYAARQEALLSNNGSTSNVSTVQTGEDLNIGASTAKDVGGSAGKRRRNVKGAMSATLGIS